MCIGLTRRSRLQELFLNLLFAECSVVFAALGFKATISELRRWSRRNTSECPLKCSLRASAVVDGFGGVSLMGLGRNAGIHSSAAVSWRTVKMTQQLRQHSRSCAKKTAV